MRVRTIQRFSMKEEDPYGSWKRLYLKFFGSPRFPWDRKRERERDLRAANWILCLSGCNSASIINTRVSVILIVRQCGEGQDRGKILLRELFSSLASVFNLLRGISLNFLWIIRKK